MPHTYTIDPELLEQALALSESRDANHVIEQGLQLLIQQKQQAKIRSLRGKLHWEGDLDAMRGAPNADS